MSLHKEINFELEICQHLARQGWLYTERDAAAYDRARALFPADVLAWVQATQPKAWDTLTKNHGEKADDTLLTWRAIQQHSGHYRPLRRGSIRARGCGSTRTPRGFNPRPPLLAGDALLEALASELDVVSIRARHCWRAMPPDPPPTQPYRLCFNPRPPLLAGDALPTQSIEKTLFFHYFPRTR